MFCTQCGAKRVTEAHTCYKCGASFLQQIEYLRKELAQSSEPQQENITTKESLSTSASLPNFVVKHWQGDYSLGYSFFINGLLINLIFAVVCVVAMGVFGSIYNLEENSLEELGIGMLVLVFVLFVTGSCVGIWQVVGIWRSANKHKQRGGKAIWAGLTQALMVLWTVSLVISIMAYILVGVSVFSLKVYKWEEQLTMCPDGSYVVGVRCKRMPDGSYEGRSAYNWL